MTHESKSPRRRPRPALLATVVVLSTLAGLLLILLTDLVISLIGPFVAPNFLLSASDAYFRHTASPPGELLRPMEGEYPAENHRINSWGYRGPEYGPKRPGSIRIVALGDSTVFGLYEEREDTWPYMLEQRLRAETGRDVEVINMGRVSVSTEGTRVDLMQYASRLDPDALIFSVGWFNDFMKFSKHPDWDERKAIEENYFQEELDRARSPLMYSHLYRLYAAHLARRQLDLHWEMMLRSWDDGSLLPENADNVRRVPISRFRENLRTFCDWANDHGVPAYFTTPALQSAPNEPVDDERRYPIVQAYAEAIVDEAQACDATLIPTREMLLQLGHDNPRDLIWHDWVHLKKPGNEAMAQLIGDFLLMNWTEIEAAAARW